MDAFAAAAAAIHADRNFGVDAVLTPADGSPPAEVRAVMTRATADAPRASAQLLVASLPFRPARLDGFSAEGIDYRIENVDLPDPHTMNLILSKA